MGIGSWGNRATRKFAKGDRGHLPPELAAKIDDVLKRLSRDASPASLREDGYQIHRLTSNRKGAHAIAISGRYRVVFRFKDRNAYDVEVVDCHRSCERTRTWNQKSIEQILIPHPSCTR